MSRISMPGVLVSMAMLAGCTNSSDKPANDPSGGTDKHDLTIGPDGMGHGSDGSGTSSKKGSDAETGTESTSGPSGNIVSPGHSHGPLAPSANPGSLPDAQSNSMGK